MFWLSNIGIKNIENPLAVLSTKKNEPIMKKKDFYNNNINNLFYFCMCLNYGEHFVCAKAQ